MAVGQFIDPATCSISSKTALEYHHFAENGIISKDKSNWPKVCLFIDSLENVLNGKVKCHAVNKCSMIEFYYITSPPQPSASKHQPVNWLPINLIPWTCVLSL
jgi:hypothetical protein